MASHNMQHTGGMLIAAVTILALVYSVSLNAVCSKGVSGGGRAMSWAVPKFGQQNDIPCQASTEYVPSLFEQMWLDNIQAQQDQYCKFGGPTAHEDKVQSWLASVQAALTDGKNATMDASVFSKHVTTYQCANSSKFKVESWIEPLAFALRHPRSVCGSVSVLDRSYLLPAAAVQWQHQASSFPCMNRSCQVIYVDLGAGAWTQSSDGQQPSQPWFFDTYTRRGLEPDRLLMWEARVLAPSEVFGGIPHGIFARHQYFNVPVPKDPNEPTHPLQVLKAIAQPGDFVILKVDVDNVDVDRGVIKALREDDQLAKLVDEFYMEYQLNFQPMLQHWAANHDPAATLADNYKWLLDLRRRGIRAHGWV